MPLALTSRAPRALARMVEVRGLLILLALVALGWAFLGLADEVMEGETHAADRALLLALRVPGELSDPVGPLWVEEMGRDLTALGGIAVLTLVTVAVAGLLWLQRAGRTALFLLAAVAGGTVVSTLTKAVFDRPRPDLVPHEVAVYTASFPSGHSMMAAVVWLTLGALLARAQTRRLLKVYVLTVATLVTLAVGVSRVYLGVHWPTDVLAGWTAGAAWALACFGLARWLGLRGRIEPEAVEEEQAGTG
jgi:undecaprenyl-diphosphatase